MRLADAMNPHFQAMDKAGATAHANRSIVFMNTVRRTIGRRCRRRFLSTGTRLEVVATS
ncbi:MAG: hypothetical protein IPP87_15825 [Ideonella sp.]|nr:hypothetical protein [Ideonella sp.]